MVDAFSACSSSSSGGGSGTTSIPAGSVVATGSITCTLTGTVSHDPPARRGGDSPETDTFSIRLSGCTTSGSNASQVTGGTVTGVIHRPSNGCLKLAGSKPVTMTVTWSPSSLRSSAVSFSGDSVGPNGSGYLGYVLPDPGGTASVTGSFAGSDNGARSTVSASSALTTAQVLLACDSSGLATQTLTGTATLS